MSDKYDYNQHRVHLSDTDSSQNYAQGLGGGYHLDIELTPKDKWPGTNPDPNKLRFNAEDMRGIASQIDALAALLDGQTNAPADSTGGGGSGSGTPQSVQKNGAPPFGPSTWGAATFLQKAAQQMAGAMGTYSTELARNLRLARDAIKTAADNHGKSESANAASGNQQLQANSDQPTSFD